MLLRVGDLEAVGDDRRVARRQLLGLDPELEREPVSEFGGKKVVREPVPIAKDEPLKLELQHFVECVRERQTPKVSGEAGRQALEVALEITRQIQALETS